MLVLSFLLQVLLLTATMDPELRQVADAWLQDPLRVRVNQGADAISKTITQVRRGCSR
jgi:superfamily II DNA/RNA helicase